MQRSIVVCHVFVSGERARAVACISRPMSLRRLVVMNGHEFTFEKGSSYAILVKLVVQRTGSTASNHQTHVHRERRECRSRGAAARPARASLRSRLVA